MPTARCDHRGHDSLILVIAPAVTERIPRPRNRAAEAALRPRINRCSAADIRHFDLREVDRRGRAELRVPILTGPPDASERVLNLVVARSAADERAQIRAPQRE